MTTTTRIFGPPGTGKTTQLLSIVEKALAEGVPPERIAYVSFSKKAAEEAMSRASERFNFDKDRFKYFRTLHSLGFYSLGLRSDEQMTYEDYLSIAEALGVEISRANDEEDGNYGAKLGDHCMQIQSLARAKMIDPQLEYAEAEKHVTIRYSVIEQWISTVNKYKEKYGKHDFSDMLERYSGALPVDIFIVDEAQDLSALQWWVVQQASAAAQHIYVAGDDDQCIYSWNGADVSGFLQLKSENDIILPKSWRVPERIMPVAGNIVNRIRHRKQKEWSPNNVSGEFYHNESLHGLPVESGEWMILVRNTKFLQSVERMLQHKGYLYKNNRFNSLSIKKEEAQIIVGWERLRKGESISMSMANNITRKINPKLPLLNIANVSMPQLPFVDSFKQKPWYEVFNKSMHPQQVEYIRSCLRNGQKLTDPPRITISTIHKVKGGEAENVAILPDYSYLSSQYIDSDEEHRVQYVGVTRSKKALYLLEPETDIFYSY